MRVQLPIQRRYKHSDQVVILKMKTTEMKKNMGVMSAISIVVGCVIGAGVFFKPYAIYQATGGAPGLGLLSWLIGGLVSIFGALTFAEIAVMIPRTGGMVTYLGEVYDRRLGFLAGWMQVVIFYPAYLAGYGVKVGTELSGLLGLNIALPVGLLIIAGVVLLNVLGSGSASRFQIISTVCKLIPLFLIIGDPVNPASAVAFPDPVQNAVQIAHARIPAGGLRQRRIHGLRCKSPFPDPFPVHGRLGFRGRVFLSHLAQNPPGAVRHHPVPGEKFFGVLNGLNLFPAHFNRGLFRVPDLKLLSPKGDHVLQQHNDHLRRQPQLLVPLKARGHFASVQPAVVVEGLIDRV